MSAKKDPQAVERQLRSWRENASYMYERLDTISLEWPTLTAQWDPTDARGERAFVASYTNGEDQEYVREVAVDTNKIGPDSHVLRQWSVPRRPARSTDDDDGADGTDEVQRLRVCPQNPQYLAGISAFRGRVYLWDTQAESPDAAATMDGHALGGFGLAWEPAPRVAGAAAPEPAPRKALLASGADDGKVCLWEVALDPPALPKLLSVFEAGAGVNEVSWDWPGRIVAACDDGKVVMLGIADNKLVETATIDCQSEGINTAALSPFAEHLLVTGSSDNFLRLWDTRRPHDAPLYENQVHTGRVNVVKWSPHRDGVFASAGMDGVVLVWNINNVGQEQTEEDAEDGPPELMFNHSGHLSGEQVQDLDWHPHVPLLLLSADENNTLMSWQATGEAIGELKVPKMPSFLI